MARPGEVKYVCIQILNMIKSKKKKITENSQIDKAKCSRCRNTVRSMMVVRILCEKCYFVEEEEIENDELKYPADHFRVMKLTPKQRARLYIDQTPESIKKFEDAQQLRKEMPKEMRERSAHDRGYRVGIVDGAIFIKSQFDKIQAEVWKDYDKKYGTHYGNKAIP